MENTCSKKKKPFKFSGTLTIKKKHAHCLRPGSDCYRNPYLLSKPMYGTNIFDIINIRYAEYTSFFRKPILTS